jgi:hypothetical protein
VSEQAEYLLRFRSSSSEGQSIRDLRRLLKRMGRSYRLHCVSAVQLHTGDPRPVSDHPPSYASVGDLEAYS